MSGGARGSNTAEPQDNMECFPAVRKFFHSAKSCTKKNKLLQNLKHLSTTCLNWYVALYTGTGKWI